MKRFNQLLLAILCLELIVGGYSLYRQLWRHHVVLPTVALDDPLVAEQLELLAAQTASGHSEDWQMFAEGLLGQGFYGEAEHAFRAAVDTDPANYMAHFGLAFCLDRTGRMQESTEEYLKAAEIERSDTGLIGSVAHCLYRAGKNELRQEKWDAALERFAGQANFAPASYQYAKLLVRSGKVERAMTVLDKQLVNTPHSLKFNALRLQALEAAGQDDAAREAADLLQRSEYVVPLDLNTNYVTPLSQRLGVAAELHQYNQLLESRDMDRLADHLEKVWRRIKSTSLSQKASVLMSMAEVAFQRRRAEEILLAVDRMKELGVSSADMLQMEGAAYQLNGDIDRAIELWLRAERMSPNIPLYQILADAYQQKNDVKRRDYFLGQAALLEAKLAFWNNQWQPALAAAQRAIEHDSGLDQAWFYLAEIERELGNPTKALDAYQQCLSLNPDHGRALAAVARIGIEKATADKS